MDLKTLEYMGQRVDQGREIVSAINWLQELKKDISLSFQTEIGIDLYLKEGDRKYGFSKSLSFGELRKKLHDAMITALVEAADAEIARLEEEFAKL